MFVRNVLKPGDVVLAAPLGVRMSLEYNANGSLVKIYTGYDRDVDVTEQLMPRFRELDTVPMKLTQKGSIMYISGVLYTSKRFHDVGNLPDAIQYSMLSQFQKSKLVFNFFAATLKKQGQKVLGATMMSQTLMMLGFKTLPNYIIPAGITPAKLRTIINPNTFNFFYPLIMDYFIFRGTDLMHASTKLKQDTVERIDQVFDAHGNILGKISTVHNKYTFDWSVITAFNLRAGDSFTLDSEGNMIFSHSDDSHADIARPRTIACPVCGRVIDVPESGKVHCADVHCASRSYPAIQRFINTMHLNNLTKEDYDALIKMDPKYKDPGELFQASVYSSTNISTTLTKLLYSLVSGVSESTCLKICNRCNNSVDTLEYYVMNPDKLMVDMKSTELDIRRVVSWFKDSKNADTIIKLMHHPQIKFDQIIKRIPTAAPIFRNVKIFITGTFKRGSLTDITEIMQSYGAIVSTAYDPTSSVVVVGSLNEGNDAISINKAKRQGTLIFHEDEFFKKYEIDDDLRQNL